MLQTSAAAQPRPVRLPDIIMVDRDADLPRQPHEYYFNDYPNGVAAAARSFWVANSTVHAIVRRIEDGPTAIWACEALNAAVVAETLTKQFPAEVACTPARGRLVQDILSGVDHFMVVRWAGRVLRAAAAPVAG